MKKKYFRIISMICMISMLCGIFGYAPSVQAVTIPQGPSLAKQVSDEGLVLLKNDNSVLPLAAGTNISVFGGGQNNWQHETASAAEIFPPYVISLMDGLNDNPDITVNSAVRSAYGNSNNEIMVTDDLIAQAKNSGSDTALITIVRKEGENHDMTLQKEPGSYNTAGKPGRYYLTGDEEAMIDKVANNFDKVILLLNIGNVIDLGWLAAYENKIDAVVLAYYAGMEGGNSVADMLTGAINPSGKTVDTFPKRYEDILGHEDFGHPYENSGDFGKGRYPNFNVPGNELGGFANIYYTEGIYVGYRYFETFGVDVVYPFGYGLSYTTFSQKTENFSISGGKISMDVVVKNTGSRAGKDIVQIYYAPPLAPVSARGIDKSAIELASYAKTGMLQPGQSETLHLSFDAADMASYEMATASYVLEKGTYEVRLGQSVHDTSVIGTYTVAADTVTEKLTNQMTIPEEFNGGTTGLATEFPSMLFDIEGLAEKRIADDNLDTSKDNIPGTASPDDAMFDQVIKGNISMEDFVLQMTDSELVSILDGPGWGDRFAGSSRGLSRLNIPAMKFADGDSGVSAPKLSTPSATRPDKAGTTGFPCSTMMACTWNLELMKQVGEVVGEEARILGMDLMLAPSLNIHRNPRCGRNSEYYSEDPLISGRIAAEYIKGMQSKGTGCTIKHFAANNQEAARKASNSIVSEQALREIYLKGFEIAIKDAKPWALMTSYNAINGEFAPNSYSLIHNILREEWGFDGFIMTDFESWEDLIKSQLVGSELKTPQSYDVAIYGKPVYLNALADGTLPRCIARANVANMLNIAKKVFEKNIKPIKSNEVTRIKAVDAIGLSGSVRAEECRDEDGGMNLGYVESDSKMSYYIDVEKGGIYNLNFRMAAGSEAPPYGKYNILVDGVKVGEISGTNTGGYQLWETFGPVEIPLSKGQHYFELDVVSGGSNLNWFEFERQEKSGESVFEAKMVEGESNVKANYTIKNYSDKKIDALCMIAKYDNNGLLKDMEKKIIPVESFESISEQITVPYSGESVKAFIWDADTFAPLCNAVTDVQPREPVTDYYSAQDANYNSGIGMGKAVNPNSPSGWMISNTDRDGAYFQWDNVVGDADASNYLLKIYYATGNAAASFKVIVNGKDAGSISLSGNDWGQFNGVSELKLPSSLFEQGSNNTIRFEFENNGGANVAQISVMTSF